jgi:predicted NBD/HSP70 family sugar kinase
VELDGADAERALAAVAELRDALVSATDLPAELIDGVVVGVPGVTGSRDGTLQLAANVPGLEGRFFAAELHDRLGLPVTLENDINLAALGERWLGVARGVDDFVFLSVGTGMGAGIVLGGELHSGRHGFAGEIDFALEALDEDVDPSAPRIAQIAAPIAAGHPGTELAEPYEARSIFDAARRGDGAAEVVVAEVARRIALHLAPVSAVVDVELVVLGGGIGSNGDLLLGPVRRMLGEWLPFPPQVEVSTVGEAAVLAGALAVGVREALDNVAVRAVAPERLPLGRRAESS